MEHDDDVPLRKADGQDGQEDEAVGGQGITQRTADPGMSVFDLGGMVADLEAERAKRQGGA